MNVVSILVKSFKTNSKISMRLYLEVPSADLDLPGVTRRSSLGILISCQLDLAMFSSDAP